MRRSVGVGLIGVVAVLSLGLSSCATQTASQQPAQSSVAESASSELERSSESPSADGQTTSGPGSYVTYAQFLDQDVRTTDGKTVLFFNATWCPTCHEADQNLRGSEIPSGLTVVSVDFDSSQDLKQQYGVTTQHTFVQIDADSKELAKFTGSSTIDEIQRKLS